jgi:hypothetical protein
MNKTTQPDDKPAKKKAGRKKGRRAPRAAAAANPFKVLLDALDVLGVTEITATDGKGQVFTVKKGKS